VSPRQPDPDGVLVVGGPIADGDLRLLCERLRALAAGRQDVVCDVRALAADAVSVNALARLQLTAQRDGCRIRLLYASSELGQLLSYCGLDGVVTLCLEPQGQPEEREQPRGVEERVDRDDAPA
jgi:ABC-type transporter Mla MlaB component